MGIRPQRSANSDSFQKHYCLLIAKVKLPTAHHKRFLKAVGKVETLLKISERKTSKAIANKN